MRGAGIEQEKFCTLEKENINKNTFRWVYSTEINQKVCFHLHLMHSHSTRCAKIRVFY